MRIGIIGPMDEEVALLQAAFTIKETQTIGGRTYQVGTYHDHEVVLVKSGIGKVCAATAATVLVNTFKVDAIVNSGCAGSIADQLKIGDIVLSDKLAYQDFDLTIFNYKKGQVPSYEQYFTADHALVAKAEAVAAKLKQEGKFQQPGDSLPTIVTGTIGVVFWQILSGGDFYLGVLPVVFGCAVGALTFFIVNLIEWKMGVEPAPSAFLTPEQVRKLEAEEQ